MAEQTLGPASIAINAYMNRGTLVGVVPRIPPDPPEVRPSHEIPNVRAKQAGAGYLVRKALRVDMMPS